jgi:zinc protease
MTRYALLLVFCAAAVEAQTAPQITEFYAGGIKVIHKPVTANDVIAVRLLLRGGSAVTNASNAGIENLMVQSLTSGTQKYSKDAFTALATSTGTQVSGTPGLDFTAISAQGVRQHFNEAWDLFTQAALQPTFPDDQVQQVRDQIVNDLKQHRDDPDSYLNDVADSLLYAGHPYAAEPEGTPETIAKLGRAELLQWHKQRMAKANLVLVVVGNVPRAELESKVAAAFGALPTTGGSMPVVPALASDRSSVTVIQRELPTNYILGLYPAPGRASPDFPALQMAVNVLSDRLFEEVRTKRNLTYAVSSALRPARQSKGTLYVTAVDPDTTVKVIFSEVRRIQNERVPASRLREAISEFITAYWMGQETNMGQATALGNWELTGGGWRNARLYVDRMSAVTPADVQRVAARYLKNARFVVIGDPKKVNQSLFMAF